VSLRASSKIAKVYSLGRGRRTNNLLTQRLRPEAIYRTWPSFEPNQIQPWCRRQVSSGQSRPKDESASANPKPQQREGMVPSRRHIRKPRGTEGKCTLGKLSSRSNEKKRGRRAMKYGHAGRKEISAVEKSCPDQRPRAGAYRHRQSFLPIFQRNKSKASESKLLLA